MEDCTSIAEVSVYVWKTALVLHRLVDVYGRMYKYCRRLWTCMEECTSIAEVSTIISEYSETFPLLSDNNIDQKHAKL